MAHLQEQHTYKMSSQYQFSIKERKIGPNSSKHKATLHFASNMDHINKTNQLQLLQHQKLLIHCLLFPNYHCRFTLNKEGDIFASSTPQPIHLVKIVLGYEPNLNTITQRSIIIGLYAKTLSTKQYLKFRSAAPGVTDSLFLTCKHFSSL